MKAYDDYLAFRMTRERHATRMRELLPGETMPDNVEVWTRNEAMTARLVLVALFILLAFAVCIAVIGWQRYQVERQINQQLMGVGYSLRPVE